VRNLSRLAIAPLAIWLLLPGHVKAVEIPRPVINIPKPVINVPRPVINVPRPVINVPKPVVNVPRPVVNVPRLTVTVPNAELVKPIVNIATTPKADVSHPTVMTNKIDMAKPNVAVITPKLGMSHISEPKVKPNIAVPNADPSHSIVGGLKVEISKPVDIKQRPNLAISDRGMLGKGETPSPVGVKTTPGSPVATDKPAGSKDSATLDKGFASQSVTPTAKASTGSVAKQSSNFVNCTPGNPSCNDTSGSNSGSVPKNGAPTATVPANSAGTPSGGYPPAPLGGCTPQTCKNNQVYQMPVGSSWCPSGQSCLRLFTGAGCANGNCQMIQPTPSLLSGSEGNQGVQGTQNTALPPSPTPSPTTSQTGTQTNSGGTAATPPLAAPNPSGTGSCVGFPCPNSPDGRAFLGNTNVLPAAGGESAPDGAFRKDFRDLREYTSYANSLPPDQRRAFLNETMATVEPLLAKDRGVISRDDNIFQGLSDAYRSRANRGGFNNPPSSTGSGFEGLGNPP
jgi:hypothetical protein